MLIKWLDRILLMEVKFLVGIEKECRVKFLEEFEDVVLILKLSLWFILNGVF